MLKSIVNAPTSSATIDRSCSWQLLAGTTAIASNQHTRREVVEKNWMLLGHIEISNGDKSETTAQSMLKDVLGLGDRLGLVSNLQVEADNKHRLDQPSRARYVHDRAAQRPRASVTGSMAMRRGMLLTMATLHMPSTGGESTA